MGRCFQVSVVTFFIVLGVVVEADFYHIFRGLQRRGGLNSIN